MTQYHLYFSEIPVKMEHRSLPWGYILFLSPDSGLPLSLVSAFYVQILKLFCLDKEVTKYVNIQLHFTLLSVLNYYTYNNNKFLQDISLLNT